MRIEAAFSSGDRLPLIPFITAGDPSLEVTLDIIRLLDEEKVTAIELGVPYSDPLADGPVIQSASERALSQGVTLTWVLELVQTAREIGVTTPLVLFSYYNPILRFGEEYFLERARFSGLTGMIIPDLPWEEGRLFSSLAAKSGVDLIPLVAPTSRERIRRIVSDARGFVYCVSSLGTTGIRQHFSEGVDRFLDVVREYSPVPTAVGFGISRAEHVQHFLNHADAVVVGSVLIRLIEAKKDRLQDSNRKGQALAEIREFIRDLTALTVPFHEG
ncbi:tryptophan synthase alpha chain [Kroppenstedtia guangzhouensis]|jgi:tryptophan synthase alpha chain|uniref:Tryptophan synthase alpha chain n=1 Tax=Kroppenstedtia guangzhouensis TaxID=1274356 RepID=A0ABQ1G882_9BACL|nr:tryptophan synthase subunit alpha [Kroppenstedtia guangzhouensis]GGA38673.1 tryptophan synthase alpha chain [Kroppenstedtia guangzhouensis]